MHSKETKHKVWIVLGTRPNFIKVTQFRKVAANHFPEIALKMVHTGQHYDDQMAQVFFAQFGLNPDVFLNIEPGHPGLQIAHTIERLTALFIKEQPDLVVVVGDVNSTLAGAIAANKCNIALAHLESGLRSHDQGMPEEHNRRVADLLSQLHFITEDSGLANLRKEGHGEQGLSFVGNTMIDTLVAFRGQIDASGATAELGLQPGKYLLATLHRPSNVDSKEGLELILSIFNRLSETWQIAFPVHPRSAARMEAFGLRKSFEDIPGLIFTGPQGYFDFQKLISDSAFVLTDSGGIQEETTFLQKPCLTLRPNTERPITVSRGSNTLLQFDVEAICRKAEEIQNGTYKTGEVPPLWDGQATYRVLERIAAYFENGQ
jgi:UDP-N-acetylglucosamine 2-epimerase (non-hydrolysing)